MSKRNKKTDTCIACKFCGSQDVRLGGKQRGKRGVFQKYVCNACYRTFTAGPGGGRIRIFTESELKAKKKAYNARPDIKAKKKAYYARPDIKAKMKAYYARPDIKAKKKAYYQEHEADIKAKMKAYYARPDIKAKMKAYYQEHEADIKAKMKAYYQEHEADIKAKKKEYRVENNKTTTSYIRSQPCPFCSKSIGVYEVRVENIKTGHVTTAVFGQHRKPYHYVNFGNQRGVF